MDLTYFYDSLIHFNTFSPQCMCVRVFVYYYCNVLYFCPSLNNNNKLDYSHFH